MSYFPYSDGASEEAAGTDPTVQPVPGGPYRGLPVHIYREGGTVRQCGQYAALYHAYKGTG